MNKVIKALDKTLDVFVIVVCILFLLIGVYSMLDNMWVYQNAMDDSILAYKPDLDHPLTNPISEEQAAWVHIYDTNIDYPIMQGEDNFAYLNKDPYGEFALSGAIFLDYRNNKELTDAYSLVYGHHMEHGIMFGSLDDFANEVYFEAHKNGRVVTREHVYDLELFAVASAEGTDSILFSPTGRTTAQITEYLKENSIIYTPPQEGLDILALSTCSGDTYTARLLVFGTLKPLEF